MSGPMIALQIVATIAGVAIVRHIGNLIRRRRALREQERRQSSNAVFRRQN